MTLYKCVNSTQCPAPFYILESRISSYNPTQHHKLQLCIELYEIAQLYNELWTQLFRHVCLLLLCQLQIWDTAGQERFRKSMVEHYYRSVHSIIFVYDVTNLSSFESIPEWIDECSRHSVGPLVPRILVGNKCDLRDNREVPTSYAQRLADGYNFPLFETSAKDPSEKEHVDAIFLTLAYRLKSHKPLRLKQPSESGVSHLWNQREQETATCQCWGHLLLTHCV